jgi:hypothetical protein
MAEKSAMGFRLPVSLLYYELAIFTCVDEELSEVSPSGWSEWVILAVETIFWVAVPLLTVTLSVNVAVPPLARLPTVHIPVAAL